MDRSTPGSPVLHHLPELAQTHAHWVSDAIQPSHPLSLPSPPALNLSQPQSLSSKLVLHIRWQSIGASASVLVIPVNIQGWFHLRLTGLISLLSRGLSRVFSSTTVGKHQFWEHFSMVQLLHPSIYDYGENYSFDFMYLYQQSDSNGSLQNRSMSDYWDLYM